MNRENHLVRSHKKRKKRFSKKNRSPINLGTVVISPKQMRSSLKIQNSYKLKIKSTNIKSKNINLTSKSPVQYLNIKSPIKHKQNSIEKYVKVTKKIEPKSYKRFNNRKDRHRHKQAVNRKDKNKDKQAVNNSKFKKLTFKFCKNLYENNLDSYFNFTVLNNVSDKLDYFKNLPIEDRYLCALISNNIIIEKSDMSP
jgi:hypothetical protein